MRNPNANTSARTVFLAIGKWTALVAAAFLTAKGEHELAILIGIHDPYAWLFPVALDVYAAVAFATHANREANIALALMVVCQSITHIQSAGPDNLWSVALTVAVSAVPPIICQRVHHLGASEPQAAPAPVTATPVAQPEPAPAPTPVAESAPTPARTRPTGRPAAVRLAQVAELIAARPDIRQADAARHLRITDRQLRNIVPGQWRTYRAEVLAAA